MANKQITGVIFVFLIAITADARSISPAPNDPFLSECLKKVDHAVCADVFRSAIFFNGPVTLHCCRRVIHVVGHACYLAIVNNSSLFIENPSKYAPRRDLVWNECVALTTDFAPTPSPIPSC